MADIKDFKVGDRFEFTVPFVVTRAGGDIIRAVLPDASSPSPFLAADLIHARILPRAIKVGDMVKVNGCPAIVKAIDGDYAWVRFTDDLRTAYRLSDLTLVEPSGGGQ